MQISAQGTKWQLTAEDLSDEFWERADRLTRLRREEQRQMQEYVGLEAGHMKYLILALDGEPRAVRLPDLPALPTEAPMDLVQDAVAFLRRTNLPIEPRKQWPAGWYAAIRRSRNHRRGAPGGSWQGALHLGRRWLGRAGSSWQVSGWMVRGRACRRLCRSDYAMGPTTGAAVGNLYSFSTSPESDPGFCRTLGIPAGPANSSSAGEGRGPC